MTTAQSKSKGVEEPAARGISSLSSSQKSHFVTTRNRSLFAGLVALSIGVLGLGMASPANAVASPSTIFVSGCSPTPVVTTGIGGTGTAVTSISWTSEGDSLSIRNNCTPTVTVEGLVDGSPVTSFNVTPGALQSLSPIGTRINGLRITSGSSSTTITMVPPGGGGAGAPAAGNSPQPIVQQFGKPATGTCNAAQPEGLNWAGVPSGGWNESWAQWVRGGNGGVVCTRTLTYSNPVSKWVLS